MQISEILFLLYFNFRIANLTYIQVQTKYATYKGKYGKIYASKEKLYATHSGFMIPKGCFFEARFDNYLCIEFFYKALDSSENSNGL